MSFFEPPETARPEPVEAGSRLWYRVTDFRAGIHSDLAGSRPPGHAQVDGTFQCYASPAGSLIPAPRMVAHITRDITDFTISDDLLSEQIRISGIYANAPVYSAAPANPNTSGPDECHTELWFGFEYWTGPNDANATLRLDVSRLGRNKETATWGSAWSRDYASLDYSDAIRPRNCVFASQRSNSAAPLVSGPQILAWVFSGNARFFPPDDDTDSSTTDFLPYDQVDDTTLNPEGLVAPTYCVGHQGRIVVFPLYITFNGANQVYISSECAYWTSVNNAGELDTNLSSAFNILGGYEHAAGYGVFASLTADELFLVKIRGGGLFVSGDLNSPTVRTLPRVRSTGLAFSNGCTTIHGHIYPVDASGVYLWAGGDNSEHITKHLEPDFWRPSPLIPAYDDGGGRDTASYGYGNTQCDAWNEFALLPNNWFWDADERGWWRILDPDVVGIHRWTSDERGRLAWGAPSGFNTSTDPIAYEFDRLLGATFYSWRSHPMEPTIDREVRISELVVNAQGHGVIEITGTSAQDPNNPSVVTIEVDSDRPHLYRAPANFRGNGIVFTVTSRGSDHSIAEGSVDLNATVEAPTLHYFDYATTPASQLPNA